MAKILIADLDQNIRTALDGSLRSTGNEVYLLENLDQLYGELARIRPDLLVLGRGVDGIDSVSLLEGVRGLDDKSIANIPVVFGSRTGDLVEVGNALRLGIKDYFICSKFNTVQVAQKILNQLGMSVSAATSLPESTKPGTVDAVRPTKVLIVEDDKFLRDLATQKLKNDGLNVSSAVDGEQGIAIAKKELPDIILLDILLPGIDGFEVLRRVKADQTLAHTRIAMLSNFGQREDVKKAMELGADAFLVKANYTLDEVVEEVQKILSKPK